MGDRKTVLMAPHQGPAPELVGGGNYRPKNGLETTEKECGCDES